MGDLEWSLVFLAVSIFVTVFFTLNNLSLKTFSRLKLQEAFKSAGKTEKLEKFFEDRENMILTCSLFSLISDSAILIIIARLMKINDSNYIWVILTGIVSLLFFRLAIPYSWSKYTGETVLVRTYPVLAFFAHLIAPLRALYHFHDIFVRRMAGVTEITEDEMQEEKQEELLSVVEQGKFEGVVDEEELEMIENVLELNDTTAEEIMTPRTDVVALDINESLSAVVDKITAAGHSRIPVYENTVDTIVGLVYAKDLLSEIGKTENSFKLRDKIRQAYFVPESKQLRDLLHEFQNQKLHIAVVLDEYGGTAGIVTIEDILEELVGEITDEYEETPQESLKKISDDTVEIDARMYIDDLNEEFEIELPEDEDYDTVGGFVFSHLGYIPKAGESFDHEGVQFTILAAEPRKIKRIRIHKLTSEKQNQ